MSDCPVKHTKEYRLRRFLNWFPLGLTYTAIYMGRYNLNVSSKTLMSIFDLAKQDFGIIVTCGFWAYAVATLINGPLVDKMGGRKGMLIGTCGATIFNLIIGLLFMSKFHTKIVISMSLLYSLNMFAQSFACLSIVKTNASWFHVRERGVFGGVFGIMISLGYMAALSTGAFVLSIMNWYWVFIVPAIAMGVMLVVDFFVLKDKPSDAGFKNFNTGDASSKDPDKDKPVQYLPLLKKMVTNRIIVTLALAEFCTGFVRYGLLTWFVPYLSEVHKVTTSTKLFGIVSIGITVGGILGGLSIGFLSDKFFHSRRAPMAFIYYICSIIVWILFGIVKNPTMAALLIPIGCIFVFGIHGILSGTCSMDFGGTKGASTVTGLFNGVHYIGASLTGVLLGAALDKWGWDAWGLTIIPFAAIGAILMLTVWNETPYKTKGKEEEAVKA
ncbi:MFS transporter [bacterium]|nr:MFS transporter [bacterium]